ncbi:hypothetical protein GCM10011351_00610 [Paraliobacillus quinghaiensis]|uniref:Sporulation histidine kinase inhibitor Sda n=1 Tax=Paraliobacillus quinghaiensis TaxID=470815 RepID=A0A917TDA9_9BACI|nr:sporulation histidine kinase inhibitor Sda [Paraliobacillus quinghaiensis]GGM18693.1 hypothetical protein GCM10011351_00610 [Paraliobacillus quinghaiensis]
MKHLSDAKLIQAYKEAIELNLDKKFIELLKQELIRRNISPNKDL